MAKLGALGFIIYLIFGLYFLNIFFNLIPQLNSGSLLSIANYVSLIGGVLLIIGGIYFLKANRFR